MVIDEAPLSKVGTAIRLCRNARRFLEHPGGNGLIEKALVLTFLLSMEDALEAMQAEVAVVVVIPGVVIPLVACDMEDRRFTGKWREYSEDGLCNRGTRTDNGGMV